jgi:hypothetical protein
MTAGTWHSASFSLKYEWPLDATFQFDISPSTQTRVFPDSRIRDTPSLISLTVYGRFACGGGRKAKGAPVMRA